MAFFNEIGKKVTMGSQQAIRQTKMFVDVNKLNGQMAEQEKYIAQFFSQLGQQYYQKYQADEAAEFKEVLESISNCYAEIESLKEQISLIRGRTMCESCGAELEEEVIYCPKCGTKRNVAQEEVSHEDMVCCMQCGKWMPMQQKFCTSCGCAMKTE